jgi:hypothetical protein
MTKNEMLEMDPAQLHEVVSQMVEFEMPDFISDIDHMRMAGELLGKLASMYSYLSSMALLAKIKKKELKAEKADKKLIDDALSREEIFSGFAENVRLSYNAISRMITVKQQINEEMKLGESRM